MMMFKYRKGEQTEKLDDLPMSKILLVMDGDAEGPWVKQGPDYVVLQNNVLHFYPVFSWGVVLPSKNPPGENRETIDITSMKPDDGLELHPEAWESFLEKGAIDAEGHLIPDEEEEADE
jgi:hypothetical protein